jgi:uncharacterized protein (TIGR00106 family)
MSVIIDFAIFPTDKGESVSPFVARALKIVQKSGLPFKFGPMGTSVEGEWDEVMAVVTDCYRDLSRDCDRIYMTMKVDYRKGRSECITNKVRSVEEKL